MHVKLVYVYLGARIRHPTNDRTRQPRGGHAIIVPLHRRNQRRKNTARPDASWDFSSSFFSSFNCSMIATALPLSFSLTGLMVALFSFSSLSWLWFISPGLPYFASCLVRSSLKLNTRSGLPTSNEAFDSMAPSSMPPNAFTKTETLWLVVFWKFEHA